MSVPFRILHVVASLQGGAAQHVVHLSQAFRQRGHYAAIAAPCDNPSLESQLSEQDIPFHATPLDRSFFLEAMLKMKNLLEREPWTHIHMHGHRAALIVRLASRLVRHPAPLIYTVHGYHPTYYPEGFTQWAVNRTEQLLKRYTKSYICVSESTCKDLLEVIPESVSHSTVVENAIPLRMFSKEDNHQKREEIRQRFAIPQDAYVIGTVGRLQWQKSISRLIRAFRLLSDRREPLFLMIVGDGPKRPMLEMLVESLQIEDRCLFTGHQGNPQDFYPAMNLFVLPSLWEGLPLTILEAWAAGTPVVATNVSGSRDMIEDGITGFLADNSIEGIAAAMERAIQSTKTMPDIVRTARERIETRFAMERMIVQIEQVYHQSME